MVRDPDRFAECQKPAWRAGLAGQRKIETVLSLDVVQARPWAQALGMGVSKVAAQHGIARHVGKKISTFGPI